MARKHLIGRALLHASLIGSSLLVMDCSEDPAGGTSSDAGSGGAATSNGGAAASGRSGGGGKMNASSGGQTSNGGKPSGSAGVAMGAGGISSASGGTSSTNGGTSSTNGGTSSTNGGTSSTNGGTSSTSGGASAGHGGTSSTSGGASAGHGGTSSTSGGASAGHGGTSSTSGGASAGHGGVTSSGGGGTTSAGGSGGGSAGGGTSAGGSSTGGAVTYTTSFNLTESSIKEGGAWLTGLDPLQTPVSTANGIAFGTQTGAEFATLNYNDSEAWLAGPFPANQRASAVIHKVPGLSGGYQEVEILLRWSVGALRTGLPYGDTHSYGYEINIAWDGQYTQIARFKGPAMFDSLVSGSPITSLGVKDGDILSAEIVGNTITSKLIRDGVSTVLGTATDNGASPFTTGSPGVGYYRGTNGNSTTNSTSFAFTSFTATSL